MEVVVFWICGLYVPELCRPFQSGLDNSVFATPQLVLLVFADCRYANLRPFNHTHSGVLNDPLRRKMLCYNTNAVRAGRSEAIGSRPSHRATNLGLISDERPSYGYAN
jgi:hypothetical protein